MKYSNCISPTSMHSSARKTCLALGATLLVLAGQTQAAMYVSTIGVSDPIQGLPFNATSWVGISFTTDGQSYYLDQVGGYLRLLDPAGPSSITGYLYQADANGIPTALVSGVSFSHAALTVGDHSVGFTPTSAVILEANANYAFIISSETVTGGWIATPAAEGYYTDVPGSSWSLPATTPYSTDGGITFTNIGAGAWRNMGSIYATPIPEPSTYLLLGVSGLAVLQLRRRRGA